MDILTIILVFYLVPAFIVVVFSSIGNYLRKAIFVESDLFLAFAPIINWMFVPIVIIDCAVIIFNKVKGYVR